MEWISVDKKYPESAALVLVAADQYIALADWDAEERRFRMASREDAALIPVETITHWMHLPELPKERHNDWSRELLLCDGVTVESRLGAAPVEYAGKADQKEYYFRSRGRCWRMAIADTVDMAVEAGGVNQPLELADLFCEARYGVEAFDASYMPLEQAEGIIRQCIRLWRSAQKTD
jgi:uncharacterized protein DUF551